MAEKRDVRRLILESARKHFLTDGFQRTTIESIAYEIQASKKTLYAQFASKAVIWKELVRIEAHKTAEYLKTHLSPDSTPFERLERLAGYVLRRGLQTEVAASEHPQQKARFGAHINEAEEASRRLKEEALQLAFPMLVEELLREAQHSGKGASGDPTLLTAMIVGAVTAAIASPAMSGTAATDVGNAIVRIARA